MPTEVFCDTAYAVVAASASDRYHSRAVSLAHQLKAADARLITTRAVIVEIGNSLSRQRFRQGAARLLAAFEADPMVEIIPLSEELYTQAFDLFRSRPDKEWGLTDCISFVVMQQRGITDALTSDLHFQQAGFRALLREDLS